MNAEQRERLQQALDFVEHASAEELDSALERADYHYWRSIGPIAHGPEDLVIPGDFSFEDELLELHVRTGRNSDSSRPVPILHRS